MKLKSLLLMARRRERLAQSRPLRGDQFPVFTPREWADIPAYHPRAD